jgi:3-hydroxyacyl-[acyl-carrier-protein] dehydratase
MLESTETTPELNQPKKERVSSNRDYLFGYREIIKMLPHRFPFLFVDRIISIDRATDQIVGQKNVTINEHFFQGHFPPSAPIMPGFLILEALAQTGGILIYQKGYENQIPVIMSVNHAKFRHPVKPGDVLMLLCQGTHFSSKGGKIQAKATVNGKVAAEAELVFALMNENQI